MIGFFELLEADTENSAIAEGARLVLGVMEKDPDRFAKTNGWGFEEMGNAKTPKLTFLGRPDQGRSFRRYAESLIRLTVDFSSAPITTIV